MKKNKLSVSYDFNFDLIGLLSQTKEYKIAWQINQNIHINLVKSSDLNIDYVNDRKLSISNYIFETENSFIRLLKNKSYETGENQELYLLPEIKEFDFFLQIFNDAGTFDSQQIVSQLSQCPDFHYVANIDLNKLKSKENLIL